MSLERGRLKLPSTVGYLPFLAHQSIRLFGWYNSPNSTHWVFHVAGVSGNQVTMEMHNCLPGKRSTIHADVVSIRSTCLFDDLLGRCRVWFFASS